VRDVTHDDMASARSSRRGRLLSRARGAAGGKAAHMYVCMYVCMYVYIYRSYLSAASRPSHSAALATTGMLFFILHRRSWTTGRKLQRACPWRTACRRLLLPRAKH
jgi:hypothetical protein